MPDSNSQNPRYLILLKEIELIRDTVKNMDDLIYKTKNFALLVWGGSLFLIADQLSGNPEFSTEKLPVLILSTATIPILFWAMHYYWQRNLRYLSKREEIIAAFINSPSFSDWVKDPRRVDFPVYDPVGWIFTRQELEKKPIFKQWEEHLVDRKEFTPLSILFYKDGKFYYPLMILISIVFGLIY